jgi:two-component system, cell cycle sensor histidine kinase and response regulator CckA
MREVPEARRDILNRSGAGVAIVDPRTRIIEWVNPTAAEFFGASADKIVGRRCHCLLCPTEDGSCPILDQGKDADSAERVLLRHDGRELPVMKSVKRILIDGKEKLVETFVDLSERKEAEAARRESEDRYRVLFETCRDAMMVVAVPAGNFVSANAATLELFGVKDEATFTALTPLDLSPATQPDGRPSADRIREIVGIAMREGSHAFEWRHRRLDGREFPASVLLTRLEFSGHTLVQATVRDLTSAQLALSALRDSEERLRLAVEATGMGTYRWDHPTGKSDFSPELLALYGLPPNGILPLGPDLIPLAVLDEDRPIFQAAMAASNDPQGDGVMKTEFRIRRPDGSIRWLMLWGRTEFEGSPGMRRPARAAGTIMDITERITERRLAEAALRESEEKFRASFMTGLDAVFWASLKDGRIMEINRVFESLYGYSRAEAIGKTAHELGLYRDPDDRARMLSELEEKGFVRDLELEARQKSGQIITVSFSASLVLSSSQQFFLGIVRDITEHKRVEEETAKLTSQLQQAQKMESVGRLAGGVAHDFNNMLGVILGHCELAMEKVDPADPLHNDLVSIRAAAQRSADLTRQLLAFARKQTVAPKVLNLNDTVAGMLKMVKRLIGENVELEWRPGENLWPVKIDPSQIDQILANLCVNARDAIANVGKIAIATGTRGMGPDSAAGPTGAAPGDYVWLSVTDDGCGMDQAMLSHVFEPFFTTKEVGKGTGLGLATVYGIVKQNEGLIDLRSEPGQGTVFTIYLPRHVGKDARARSDAMIPTLQPGQETILLVEDEAPLLTVTQRILQKRGYQVLTASTPGQAIQVAREHAGNIDLLITDVVMPEMNGRDLAKNFLSLYPQAKRLFMSGYTADVIAHQGVLDEGVCFIQKPFSAEDLAATVRRVLEDGSTENG